MKWPMWIGMVLVLTIGTGCGGDGGGASIDTPAQIETSIGDGCKKQVVRDPFPKDGGHERFRSLAQNAHLIRCADSYKLWSDANLSAYARFASHPQLMKAIASIKLPPARYEHFCLTDREAFTTEFFGSSPVCKALGGEGRRVREPPVPYARTHRTYLAQDGGSAGFLEFKPKRWSSGGMAGSDTVGDVVWRAWTPTFALGAGTSGLRGPCAIGAGPLPRSKCRGQNAYYQARARVLLDMPRFCNDQGSVLRFFSRARFQVYMREGNPFQEPVGWLQRKWSVKAYKGKCFYFPAGPLSG